MERVLLAAFLLLAVAGRGAASSGQADGFTSQQCFTCHSNLAMLDMLVGLKVPPLTDCSI